MRVFRYILVFLIIATLGVLVFSYFKKNDLPGKDLMRQSLYNEPLQEGIGLSDNSFKIEQDGFTYIITPLYKYEIFGLSVAEYDSENWFDTFHKKDPLNKKDICLIWGQNVKTGAYENVKFQQGEFICFWKAERQDIVFNNNEISNNHLLPATDEIYQEFKKAQVSDQVYIKGYLANYHVIGQETNFFRNTSISRNDTGDGSCEVIYVTDFKILAKGNIGYRLLYNFSFQLLLFLIIVYLINAFLFFSFKPLIEKKEIIKEIDIDPTQKGSFPKTFRDNF